MLKFPTCILVLSCRRISFCREEWRQTGRISFLDSKRTLEMALFNLIKMPPPIEQNNEITAKVLDFFKEGNTQKYIAQYAFEGVEPKFSRAAAWNHLYVFIQDHLDELKDAKSDSELYSRACAELSGYLATFGQYRFSTKLMMTNKVIFAPVLHSLIQTASQQNITAYQDRFSQDQIKALIDTTRSALQNATKEVPLAVTDALISKILHGTFACIPAFDRYFIAGIRILNRLPRLLFFSEQEISNRKRKEILFPINLDQNFAPFLVWAFNPEANTALKKLVVTLPRLEYKFDEKNAANQLPTMRIIDQLIWSLGRYLH
mgnify:CR=1 FL=1